MKAIKIILGIIIAITLVFFATGLIVKEVQYTTEVEVNKSVEEVFKKFQDIEFRKKWLPEIKLIEPINETPQKIGSTYKMIIENQGQEMQMTEKIKAYEQDKKITYQFTSNEMLKTDDYNFISEGNITKIIQHSTVYSNSYLLACTFPWFKGKFEQLSQNYMNRFKELVEKR